MMLYLLVGLATLVPLYAVYAYYVYKTWEKNIGTRRVSRACDLSQSNNCPPDVRAWEVNKNDVLKAVSKHPTTFQACELLRRLKDSQPSTKLKKPIPSVVPYMDAKERGKMPVHCKLGYLSNKQASQLDMDHIYVPFLSFLWANTFIGPNAMFLWMKEVSILWVRVKLQALGLLKPKPCDAATTVGKLCLEGTLAIHYYADCYNKILETNVAGFFFRDFPVIQADGTIHVHDIFAIHVNLATKKMMMAILDDEILTASEALILCWWNASIITHSKVHAMANWGINIEPGQKIANPFPAQNGLVTVVYNYFGFTTFFGFIPFWQSIGLLSHDWNPESFVQCLEHGIKQGIWSHPKINELAQNSRFVRFILAVRPIFMKEFARHKDICFPGIHAEAMFLGTIIHSLDHVSLDRALEDPLWLDVKDKRFGKLAEIGRIVKAGFVQDVPGLYFHRRYKGSGHPFYEEVYKKAAKIDKDLANHMDTCIIK